MRWLRFLLPIRQDARLAELAGRIAARNRPDIWERVYRRARTMDMAEARGYVRARVAAVIQPEVELALARSPKLAGRQRLRLVCLATEAAVTDAVAQLVAERSVTLPCTVETRTAA